ncbi:MAG: response regulator [Helicobacteraceae bacterium]|nr:response regulator [Helicobacteraceae bacterium]
MFILVVDDSKIARQIIVNSVNKYFSERNKIIKIYEAEDGVKALEMLNIFSIDIMFLDVNMPIMGGEEVLLNVRANPEYNKLKIIMATTEGSKNSVLQMMKRANGYLVKPVQEKALVATLTKLTARMK